jgi:hypothetical protein
MGGETEIWADAVEEKIAFAAKPQIPEIVNVQMDTDCSEAVKRERMKHLGTRRKWHVTANPSLSSSKRTGSAAVSTPPADMLACDHGRRQVSWLAGRCPLSPSRDPRLPVAR